VLGDITIYIDIDDILNLVVSTLQLVVLSWNHVCHIMPSRERNKEVKMASDMESCTGESEAENDDEVYVEAEKTDSGVNLVSKWKTKALMLSLTLFPCPVRPAPSDCSPVHMPHTIW